MLAKPGVGMLPPILPLQLCTLYAGALCASPVWGPSGHWFATHRSMPQPKPCLLAYMPIACRFDGLTQLHAFEFEAGQVNYRSRHLFPAIEQHLARGGSTGSFGPPPAPGGGQPSVRAALLHKLMRALRLAPPVAPPRDPATGKDLFNAGVTVGRVAGK